MPTFLNLRSLRETAVKELEAEYHVRAELVSYDRSCPNCESPAIGHGRLPLYIRDLPSHGKRVTIHLDAPRLICKSCRKTFTASVEDIDGHHEMTARLAKWIGRQGLDYPFTEIAKQVGVAEKTVRTIFGKFVSGLEAEYRRETPVILGMDEVHMGRYRGVITNIGDSAIIDMLENRYKKTIVEFLRGLEHPERITHAAIDMYRPYKEAIQEVLPHVTIVADRYHVARMGNESLERIRKGLRQSVSPKVNLALKHDRKLLLMRQKSLNDQQYLLVTGWLNNFPILKAAYDLKERYYDIWNVETKEEAMAEYLRWQDSIPPELAKAFRPIPVAWRGWRQQILGFFDDKRITNAFTESFNAKIRNVYRNGHGYSFEVLRAKVLFSDWLQKRVKVVDQVRVPKKRRFDDIPEVAMARCFMMTMTDTEADYEIKPVARIANLGTSLPTLLDEIDDWAPGHLPTV